MNELMAPETVSFLERATRDPTIDVDKLTQLIALQERVERRQAEIRFGEAMNRLQEELPTVTRDRLNPLIRSRYATYEAIDRIIRPYYVKHGFSVSFRTAMNGNRVSVTCVVRAFGHEETNTLESGPDLTGSRGQANKTEVQGIGSIVSYLRRYTLIAAFAVALENDETDDDGESMRGAARRPPPPPPPPPTVDWVQRLANLRAMLVSCVTMETVNRLYARSKGVIASAPDDVSRDIEAAFAEARKRLTPPAEESANGVPEVDPVLAELLAEVDLMSLDELIELPRNAAWQRKTGQVFPPDMDQLIAHIEMRRQQLKGPSENG